MLEDQVAMALSFKQELERDYQKAAGFASRAYFSAVYSLPQVSPILWVNLNPGGTPMDHQVLSDEQLSRGQHEFWDGHGRTSKATGAFLERVIAASAERLRSVQGTNVAWERSSKGGDIDLRAAAKRTAPFLLRYIQYVQPRVMIFGGLATLDLFVASVNARVLKTGEVLLGNWGTSQARIFVASTLDVPRLGTVETISVSHPSRGVRAGVPERCRARLSTLALPKAITVT